MTPLKIQMMLHYYAIAEPYSMRNPAHANSPAVAEQREALMKRGLLYPNADSPSGYSVTHYGELYVNRLQAVEG